MEKYYAHLAPSKFKSAVQRLHKKDDSLPKTTQNSFCTILSATDGEGEAPLTGSFERCYVPEVALIAGVAKLAYAADSKSKLEGFRSS